MLSQNERSSLQRLMKQIKPLEFCGSRTTSLLKRQRSLRQNYYRLKLNWSGLLVQNSMRCLAFRNLLLIEPAWGKISLLLILPLLVILCLSHLLIMLILRTMNIKLKQLVRTQTRANLFQEHLLRMKRKRLETPGLRRLTTKSLNQRSRISVITVEFQGILVQIATSGQPFNKVTV